MDEALERTPHPEEDRVEPSFTLDRITRRYVDPKLNISRKVSIRNLDVNSGFFEVMPEPTVLAEPGHACARVPTANEVFPAMGSV
eukprot:8141737-Alexandrium_andersonii.AAC.1